MNFLEGKASGGEIHVAGHRVAAPRALPDGDLRVGVRPEYLSIAEAGHAGVLPAVVERVQDVGTHQMLTANINGQIVKAFVVLRAGHVASDAMVMELQDFVKSQVAPYKYPRAIQFVDQLPRTATGKLQRFRLHQT